MSRRDDALPERFVEEPLKKGASEGQLVKRVELEKVLDKYYKLRT